MGLKRLRMVGAVVCALASVVATGERARSETLTIGAAHTLKGAFEEIVPMFEKEYGATVRIVYGPSQTLRRQIEQGAPIDVFLSATQEIETLQKKGLTLNGGLRTYAQTSLVLVMATNSPASWVSLRDALPDRTIRVAFVDPNTSALGVITAKTLTQLDPMNKHIQNRSRLLRAEHGDDVVDLVRAGAADVGIVYRVDAIHNSGQVRIIDETPGGAYTPVQFGQAVVWTCRDAARQAAEDFFDFIASARIQKLLLKYGFDPVP